MFLPDKNKFCLGQFLILYSNNLLFSKTITSRVPQLNHLHLKGHLLVAIRYITQPVFHLAFYSIPCDSCIQNIGTAAKAHCAPSPAGRSNTLRYNQPCFLGERPLTTNQTPVTRRKNQTGDIQLSLPALK